MKITVERITSDNDSTISAIFIDGQFQCFGLEDEYRADKVAGETRIPAGEYPVRARTEGGFHNRYSDKFSAIHRGMLHIQDVPGFEWILIHVGNTDDHTAGCLLVGTGANSRQDDMSIQSSVEAYKGFYLEVIDAAVDDDLTIEFIDRDR
jgi:hypothetical protein